MDNFINKRLDGRYQIEELIGSGGMANVYKALDLKEHRTVAVKILREELMDNQDLVRRFKNESKAISVLNHPNIVKVYDVSVSDKMQYIVMEYIDGITLKEYMEQRGEALTYKETLHFVGQILVALQHAHEKAIVHRDIKPQNIMLLLDSSIKVMDFGIARFSRSESQTITDKAIGSVHYISPEQAKGDATDLKADIYSVGVMMYEMLTGKLPFESDSAVSVAIKQISDAATPLRQINPAVPEALEAITERAMAKDPKDRYQSAREMMFDIEEFKKNPSVRFEYKYMSASPAGARYVDKVAGRTTSKTSGTRAKSARTGAASAKKKHYALPVLAGMALAFAVGAAILVFLILKMSGNEFFSKVEIVTLPNFVGKTAEEIKNSDKYAEFNFNLVYEYNTTEEGKVFDQSPMPPKEVKANATITLKVSKGVQIVEIPEVIGWTKEDARNALIDAGITVMMKPQQTSEIAEGQVISTDPAAGTSVSSGDTVIIYYAQAPQVMTTTVPAILNMLDTEARTALAAKQLHTGTITQVESELPAGTIIDQSPAAGTVVTKGSAVNITISLGYVTPTTMIVPDLSGGDYTGVTVVVVEKPSDTVPKGKFVRQDPAAGAEVAIGSTVTVYISSGPAGGGSSSSSSSSEGEAG